MAEGLSEIQFRGTPMLALTLFVVTALPCAGAAAAPSNTASSVSAVGRPVHLSLINLSGNRRQVRLKSGITDLPVGMRVDVDSCVGATLYIVSDADESVDEQVVIKSGDDARVIPVR
jgi:hypothetical protein